MVRSIALKMAASLPILLVLSLASPASAEHAKVQLKDGSELSGELNDYVPGDHVSVTVGGKVIRVAAADAISVKIGSDATTADSAPVATAVPSAPTPEAAQAVVLQNLLVERQYWTTRYTSPWIPASLIPAGAILMIVGGVLFAMEEDIQDGYRDEDWRYDVKQHETAGKVLMIGGAVAAAAGLAVLPFRTSKGRQDRELKRVDDRLQALGVQASIAPWLLPRRDATRGTSAGLAATIKF